MSRESSDKTETTIDSFFEDDVPEKLAYKAQLTNMSTEKLTTLLAGMNATEDAETKAWAKLQDETKFFSEPRAQADHDSWSKMPYWDLDEATALSFDKDPRFVNWPNIGPHVNDSPFADQYSKLRLIVLRAENAGERIEDRESIISERESLRVELAKLKAELEASGGSLKPRELESLMKLIHGIAKAKFNYDPTVSRSSAAGNISKALASKGLNLDQDTVRKWLGKADQLLSKL